MGELVLVRDVRKPEPEFASLEPAKFAALCWSVEAAAKQLAEIAGRAAIYGGTHGGVPQQETYVTMMLGPLAAIDRLRNQLPPPIAGR